MRLFYPAELFNGVIPFRPFEHPPVPVAAMYGFASCRPDPSFDGDKHRVQQDNLPAVDILQLDKNEGVSQDNVLSLLFASYGSMEDLVKTVASMSLGSQTPPMRIVLSEKDHCLCLRNVALMVLAMSSNDPKATAELCVHLLYSAYLPIGYLDEIISQLEPYMENSPHGAHDQELNKLSIRMQRLLHDPLKVRNSPRFPEMHVVLDRRFKQFKDAVLNPTKETTPQSAETNKWRVGRCSLKYEHPPEGSPDAFMFFRQPFIFGVNMQYPLRVNQFQGCREYQLACEECPGFFEHPDRIPSGWRVSRTAFLEEQVLLPYGHERNGDWAKPLKEGRKEEDVNTGNWVQNPWCSPFADPLRRWSVEDVLENKLAPKHDLYGKLFYFVRDLLEKLIIRLQRVNFEFEVHCQDHETLQTKLAGQKFDRIYTTNIDNDSKMGVKLMLERFGPLLQPKNVNPSARLISLRHECDEVTPELATAFTETFPHSATIWRYHKKRMTESWIDTEASPEQGYVLMYRNIFFSTSRDMNEMCSSWEDTRVQQLNRVGAPLGMEVQNNVLTPRWPYRLDIDEIMWGLPRPSRVTYREKDYSARYFEWQKIA
ncbi:hypothetical protein NPX13_g9873 [Xylaria arbuscula]|uniref:DUF4470 domain-containing protein n=1 Tax=Xylaria arbuscula TaxID=114810 RepID=A0A9W8TIG3_9PEZI|nr:hypothetical protein NPX13_g9873 [Xylaria arbuscula]